jgi:hypothetical protein
VLAGIVLAPVSAGLVAAPCENIEMESNRTAEQQKNARIRIILIIGAAIEYSGSRGWTSTGLAITESAFARLDPN